VGRAAARVSADPKHSFDGCAAGKHCSRTRPAWSARNVCGHLDAIAGAARQCLSMTPSRAAGLRLLVDAGLAELERTRELRNWTVAGQPLAGIIAGLNHCRVGSCSPKCGRLWAASG